MLINKLLPLVMNDVGAIGKKHKNSQGAGYDFRSIEDALNFIQPVLIKHGISLATNCRDIQHHEIVEVTTKRDKTTERRIFRTTLVMDVEFIAEDGSSRKFSSVGEGLDYGSDKASNKAMSAAFKYAMFLGLAIPIEAKHIDDSDRSTTVDATSSDVESTHDASRYVLCSPTQQERIKSRAKAVGVKPAAISANLKAKGIKKLADLSFKQANLLILYLENKGIDGVPF